MAGAIGAKAFVAMNGNDVSGTLNDFKISTPQDVPDNTRFSPGPAVRRFLSGLIAGTVSLGGFSDLDFATFILKIGLWLGNARAAQSVTICPVPAIGNLAVFANMVQTTEEHPITPAGVINAMVNGQISGTSPGLCAGVVLHSPMQANGVLVDVVQLISTNADYAGGPVTLNGPAASTTITPGDSLASIQTKLATIYGVTNGHIVASGTSYLAGTDFMVSGAGSPEMNGLYHDMGPNTSGGGATDNYYMKVTSGYTHFITHVAGRWGFHVATITGTEEYYRIDASTTPPLTGYTASGGAGPNPTLAAVADPTGSLNVLATFSGSSVTHLPQRLMLSGTVGAVVQRTTAGGSLSYYNVISATFNGPDTLDGAAAQTSNNGAIGEIHMLPMTGATPSMTGKIQHAVDAAGSPGTWVDLMTFAPMTAQGVQRVTVAPGTVINGHLRFITTAVVGNFSALVTFSRQ